MTDECPTCGYWTPKFVEVPTGPEMVKHYSHQTLAQGTHQMEAFFSAVLDGRVSLVPSHRGGALQIVVAPPVQNGPHLKQDPTEGVE